MYNRNNIIILVPKMTLMRVQPLVRKFVKISKTCLKRLHQLIIQSVYDRPNKMVINIDFVLRSMYYLV